MSANQSRSSAIAFVVFTLLLAVSVATLPSGAATAGIVVGVTIPSATMLDANGCRAGTSGVTEFGTVLPGSRAVTSAACVIAFGSSNDSSRLRVRQYDGTGQAMGSIPTGALDIDFDTDGRAAWDHPSWDDFDVPYVAEPDAQGRLVIAGETYDSGLGIEHIALARIMPNGSLDPTFDGTMSGDGLVQDMVCRCEIQDIAHDRHGRIVAVSRWWIGAGTDTDLAVFRYSTTGVRDPTFGDNGYVRIDHLGSGFEELHGVYLTDDDEIIAVGLSNSQVVLVKLRPDGQLDSEFDGDGIRLVNTGAGTEKAVDVVELPDGKLAALVLRGSTVEVLKFDPDTGATIMGWGVSGVATLGAVSVKSGNPFAAPSFAVDGGGRIVVGTNHDTGSETDLAIGKIVTSTGAIDTAWGAGGIRTYDIGGNEGEEGVGILLHGDGRVMLSSVNTAGPWIQLLRVTSTGALDTTFGTGGVRTITEQPVSTYHDAITRWIDGGVFLPAANAGGWAGVRLDSNTIPDWPGTWASAGFGACLEDTDAPTTDWTEAGLNNCTDAGTAMWNQVTPTASSVARTSGAGNVSASLRFGFRPGDNQASARYEAPITFEVIAPA